MAKRKKAKSRKKSSAAKKTGGRKRSTRGATLTSPPLRAESSSALTPAPALPVAERGGRRERETRGGKPTVSTHELLAEVPPPPRARPTPQQPKAAAPRAPGAPMTLAQIYETLAALLVPYARKMETEMHPKIGFCLKARSARTGREAHFGAVQALPNGVAYHLFPLYGHPELLENVSPELFNRMRGQTCFHFEELDAGLLSELAEMTRRGLECFLADGMA